MRLILSLSRKVWPIIDFENEFSMQFAADSDMTSWDAVLEFMKVMGSGSRTHLWLSWRISPSKKKSIKSL